MKSTERLAQWVAIKHRGQLIKRTNAPYFCHLINVAELAGPKVAMGYEIGLCHDLLEDTSTTEVELLNALCNFGYANEDAIQITSCVVELTDVFTADAYPRLAKAIRKKNEEARLLTISATAQTIKYADLVDNIEWVLTYDRKHAERYLKKKQRLLADLNRGSEALRQQTLRLIEKGLLSL